MKELTARVHRFRDTVAIDVGDGSTAYFSRGAARRLAKAINACVRDIDARLYADAEFVTVRIGGEGKP